MATIDSNGVLFYQDSDNFTPPASLNLAQANLSSLIGNNTRFRRVANITARDALAASIGTVNITPDNPLLVWRADAATGRQLEVTTNGTTWNFYETGYDTGWLSLSQGTVKVWARRYGGAATVHIDMAGLTRMTDNVVNINGGAPLLPPDMLPPHQVFGTGLADQPGVRLHPSVAFVATNGALGIVKPPEATTGLSGTITYVL